MLAAPGLSSYGFTYDNWGANPGTTLGTSVVPGTSNAEGSWTQVASGSNIAYDIYWIVVRVFFGASNGVAKNHLLDIGVDPAGGTSYTAKISNIVCGQSSAVNSTTSGPQVFCFPLLIKAGSSVAVRIQGSHTTAGSVLVAVKFYGQPSNPEIVPVGHFSETVGAITNSNGVSYTPGNAADGSWTSLGTTAQDLWWWQLCVQCNNTAILAQTQYIELAFGDGSTKVPFMKQMMYGGTAECIAEKMAANLNLMECYVPIRAGSTLYVRGRDSAAPESGWNAVAIGIGG